MQILNELMTKTNNKQGLVRIIIIKFLLYISHAYTKSYLYHDFMIHI